MSTGVTVSVAVPVMPPNAAEIIAVPAATPAASPPDETVATPAADVSHVLTVVTSQEEPSVCNAVAVNAFVPPAATDAVAGVKVMETIVPPVTTARVAVPVIPSNMAVMVVVPSATPVASPVLASIAATARADDDHIDSAVTSPVVPSE